MAEFQEAIGGGMPVLPIEIMAIRASAQQAKVLAVDFVRTTEATAAGPSRSSISTRSNGTGNERSIASSMRISGSRDSVNFNSSGRNMRRPF